MSKTFNVGDQVAIKTTGAYATIMDTDDPTVAHVLYENDETGYEEWDALIPVITIAPPSMSWGTVEGAVIYDASKGGPELTISDAGEIVVGVDDEAVLLRLAVDPDTGELTLDEPAT